MKILLLTFYFLFSHWSFIECGKIRESQANNDQGLLIISYDAFRPEYLHRSVTPNLNKFRKEGTAAPYMLNVFPTKTFVNHHSIATGLYPDVHGVTANEIYDAKKGRLAYSYDLFHYDESVVPIWVSLLSAIELQNSKAFFVLNFSDRKRNSGQTQRLLDVAGIGLSVQ